MTNNYQKLIVPIKGMHCKSCEILIEDELIGLKAVKKVKADWRRNEAEIKYEGQAPDMAEVEEAIRRTGYDVGTTEQAGFFSRNKKDYQELGLAFLFLVVLYFVLKGLGITNLSINTSSGLTIPLILLIGLTAGFSTCMALSGGLILGVSARYNEKHPEATPGEKFYPHLLFNSGRVLSYTVLGGVLGLLGSAFQLSSTVLGYITIIVGLIMLLMGLQLINIFPWAEKIKFTLPKSLSRALGIKDRQQGYSHNNSFILGALTFFLPCGFTQAMQVYAISTGNFFQGAVIMGAFALGTMPGLLSIGGITSAVKGLFARRFFKFAGLAVMVFAVFNISNGFGLAGIDFAYGQTKELTTASADSNVTMENGVQVVRMKETNNGYEPNSFTIKKDLPVKWIIDAQAPYSCASTIILAKYNIRKNLMAGENIIEFTPQEIGRLKFSCSMGMYTGVFNVVDKNGQGTVSNSNTNNANTALAAAPSGSCGVAAGGGGGGCGGSGGGCGGSGGCGCGGGGKQFTPSEGTVSSGVAAPAVKTPAVETNSSVQNINSTFQLASDIVPNTFKVKVGVPVHYTIDVQEDGVGCMSGITIQTLYNQVIPLQAGEPLVMDFTPQQKGTYLITCGMGVPRGKIIVE